MPVHYSQRNTREKPCKICGGYDQMPRGRQQRCPGYESEDGRFTRCGRDEFSGNLSPEASTGLYVHFLAGPCKCGSTHGDAVMLPPVTWRPRLVTPEAEYPPQSELLSLLDACIPTVEDPGVRQYLVGRSLDPELIDADKLAFALPEGTDLPRWAQYGRRTWLETGHRLLVPVFDPDGCARSVRAARIVAGDDDLPKRLPPAGHKAGGLVLADINGRRLLSSAGPEWVPVPNRIVVAEGEPDFMTWATWLAANDRSTDTAVLGVISGSWTPDFASRVPDDATVIIRTHLDPPGNAYAKTICKSLAGRCRVFRQKGADQ